MLSTYYVCMMSNLFAIAKIFVGFPNAVFASASGDFRIVSDTLVTSAG